MVNMSMVDKLKLMYPLKEKVVVVTEVEEAEVSVVVIEEVSVGETEVDLEVVIDLAAVDSVAEIEEVSEEAVAVVAEEMLIYPKMIELLKKEPFKNFKEQELAYDRDSLLYSILFVLYCGN